MPNLTGQSIGRYHILEQLGEGGMATVFKAYDTRLERDVAIKVIRNDAFPSREMEPILKRFDREARALSRLTHPNIVGVIDFGDYDGKPYLVMEYLPGGTLKERLGRPIHWQEAARMLLPVARALQHAHQMGIIHRDVKPSNILITLSGEPMLTDFGIAKILEGGENLTQLTSTGMGVGTPEYMAPEQWTGQVTAQSDIYSLGVVLYEMLTGRKPYSADTPAAILLKQATEPLPPPMLYVADLPEAVEKILFKALARNSEDRYLDMAAFAEQLERMFTGRIHPDQPETATRISDSTNATLPAGQRPSPQEVRYPARPANTAWDERMARPPVPPPPTQIAAAPLLQVPPPSVPAWRKWILPVGITAAIGCIVLAAIAALFVINKMNRNTPGSQATQPSVPGTGGLVTEAPTPSATREAAPPPTSAPLPSPSETLQPTETMRPSPISPTDTPEPATLTLFADKNYLCLEGPGSSYQHAVDVYQGTTHTIIGRSRNNPSWYLLAINQSNTHHTCCWIGGGKVTGDIGQAPYTEQLCP
jgi:tRNA A-37 threonylcarbamoyl transferase component Bud32